MSQRRPQGGANRQQPQKDTRKNNAPSSKRPPGPVLPNLVSTAISDAVMTASCAYALYLLVGSAVHLDSRFVSSAQYFYLANPSRFFAAIAFLIIGVAAALGTLRFGGVGSIIPPLHAFVSEVARFVGVPLLGATLLWGSHYVHEARAALLSVVAICAGLFVLVRYIVRNFAELCSLVLGVPSLFYILLFGAREVYASRNIFDCVGGVTAVCGSLIYILAGAVIGVNGKILGIPRVDIFHYALAVANVCLALALDHYLPH